MVDVLKNKMLQKVADWLLIAGGLNWGLIVFNFNLVEAIIPTAYVKIVYGLVGLAAAAKIYAMVRK